MAGLVSEVPKSLGQGSSIPREFVYLSDVDPSILRDIKYAGPDNFTGRHVPGYGAAECILLLPVAQALKQVQADLAPQNLSLKVYDCYRPNRAVQAFEKWSNDGTDSELSKRFFPRLQKNELFAERYISTASGHSRGNVVDLTLVQRPVRSQAAFDPKKRYGACNGPAEQRAPDNSIDMGTGFDCFDIRSHTASSEIAMEQQRWRMTLVNAMQRRNFKNYAAEWWHFTYQMARTTTSKVYDFPILARSRAKRAVDTRQ